MKAGTQGNSEVQDLQIKNARSIIPGEVNEEEASRKKSSETSPVRPKTEEEHVRPCEDEDQEGMHEGEEEAIVPRKMKNPRQPTKIEVEEHNLTHMPFRQWCPHCVRGKAINSPHKAKEERPEDTLEDMSRISMDYWYMGINDEKAQNNPMLMVIDESTGAVIALAVGRKGVQ